MSQRFEREIEEIIEKEGDFLTGPASPQRSPRGPSFFTRASRFFSSLHFNSSRLLLATVAVAVIIFLLLPIFGGASDFLAVITILAVALFLVSYAASFFSQSRRGTGPGSAEKRWRGHPINDRPWGPSLLDHFARWLRRR